MTGLIRMSLIAMVLWLPTSVRVPAAGQDTSKKEPPPAEDAQQSGHVEFDRVCRACHGAEARGDAAPRLVPFTREYEELLGIVREGTGQMPPISARQLTDEGVAQIVAYLKSLSQER
jgi:mono/diheme cytochrome c family protein